jgi:hypothetical protein
MRAESVFETATEIELGIHVTLVCCKLVQLDWRGIQARRVILGGRVACAAAHAHSFAACSSSFPTPSPVS